MSTEKPFAGDEKSLDGVNTTTPDPTSAQETSRAPAAVIIPDGGLQAWLSVLGGYVWLSCK